MRSVHFFISAIFGFFSVSLAATPQEKIQQLYDSVTEQSPSLFTTLTEVQRNELFQKAATHWVAGLNVIDRYDHQPTGVGDGEIGFCYGRAMAVHLLARKMGLDDQGIQKIFIAGDLNNGQGVRWRFHMATMVRGDDNNWYIIDPIMPSLDKAGVIPPYEWMQTVKTVFDLPDGEDESHFFVTDTHSIMVDMRVVPAQSEFEIQDRLIEPSFDPQGRPGFQQIQLQNESAGPYPVYYVSGSAQSRYFIMRDEAPVNRKKLNDFDFFSIAIVILYKFPNETNLTHITRAYQYNGYFVDLVNSVASPLPPPRPPLNALSLSLIPISKPNPEIPWLYGFAQPEVKK